jgi:hypothetical protein
MTTLYVSTSGEVSPLCQPFSKIGPNGATILGVTVDGFVSLEAERGLRAMLWPEMQSAQLFPRLTEVQHGV